MKDTKTYCGSLPKNVGFPNFTTGIVEQPNPVNKNDYGKICKDNYGRLYLQTEHGRIY
jgi:hypothetical protein